MSRMFIEENPEVPRRRSGSFNLVLTLRIRKHSLAVGIFVLAISAAVVFGIAAVSHPVLAENETSLLEPPAPTDFSKFRHDNQNHTRLPCLLCHRRETNAARPTLPGSNGHLPCAGCHAQQFAETSGPMCNICHTDAPSGKLKGFPRLSSFNMKFDHGRHAKTNSGCATCHRPARAGVAMTIPSGLNAHVTCYQCHSARATSGDRDISSCGVCHQPGRHARMSVNAASFRVGFSHAKHNQSEGLTCNECHRVRAGAARRNQVSAPQALNHHASPAAFSCMSCHNGKRAFGGDDFSVCKRCHTKAAWHF